MKSAASLGQQLAGARVDRIIKRTRASATPLPFPALEGRVLVMMPMGADRFFQRNSSMFDAFNSLIPNMGGCSEARWPSVGSHTENPTHLHLRFMSGFSCEVFPHKAYLKQLITVW
jgi:hypothetical protein